MSSLWAALDGARVVVVAGPGGVGKTTTAAAIGVALADRGRRTMVLTVDPARRLNTVFGVTSDEPIQATPTLRIAMLESERAFHALLPRMVPDPAARARIEASPVFQRFSRSLARSHAYAALETLHAFAFGPEAPDVVVLDTPPMRGVLDLLDAPLALERFAGSTAVDLVAGKDTAVGWAMRRALGLLLGAPLSEALAEFVAAFAPFRVGFAERAAAVAALLRGPDARTVLVTSADPVRIADALALRTGLRERGIAPAMLVGSMVRARTSPRWALDGVRIGAEHEPALAEAHALGERARRDGELAKAELERLARQLGVPLSLTRLSPTEPVGLSALRALST